MYVHVHGIHLGGGSEGAYLRPAIVTEADCEVYKILHGPLEIEKALLSSGNVFRGYVKLD